MDERSELLRAPPVQVKFGPMQFCPFPDQLSRARRDDLAFDDSTVETDHRLLPLMLSMEMRRSMIIEEHANNNTEEGRDDRHSGMLTPAPNHRVHRRCDDEGQEKGEQQAADDADR